MDCIGRTPRELHVGYAPAEKSVEVDASRAVVRLRRMGLLAGGDWAARSDGRGPARSGWQGVETGDREAVRLANSPRHHHRRSRGRLRGVQGSLAPPGCAGWTQLDVDGGDDSTCSVVSGRSCPPLRATELNSPLVSPSWLCVAISPPPRTNAANISQAAGALRYRNLCIGGDASRPLDAWATRSTTTTGSPQGWKRSLRSEDLPVYKGQSAEMSHRRTRRSNARLRRRQRRVTTPREAGYRGSPR